MSTLWISRLELENWMNFTKVELDLARRMFIVGPNASGKSNLLNSFRFLHDLVTEGGGIARAVEVRGSMKKMRSLYARQNSTVRVCVTVSTADGDAWKYDLGFTHKSPKEPVPLVEWENVERIRLNGTTSSLLSRPTKEDQRDPERLSQTALQQVTANQEFRDLAEFFRSISYLHAVPHLIREGQAAPAFTIGQDPYGRDLLQRIRETPPRTKRARLQRIEKVLKHVTPQLQELSQIEDSQGRPHLQARFQHWRPQGAYQLESQFSDGTLRLIGLLWALQETGGPLLLEEPELSLHSAIVSKLGPFIYRAQRAGNGRQVLLSTHSVDLLTDEGISADEIVLIQTTPNGSQALLGARQKDVRRLMDSGIPASEAVVPQTRMNQLKLFDTLAP